MFFLLNTVVVKIGLGLELPRGLESLANLSPASAVNAGCELYAKHPRLEYDRPDIARWYCQLLHYKHPAAGAAHFYKTPTGAYAGRLADAELPDLVRFWNLQNAGIGIGSEVHAVVWAAPKLVA